MSDLFPGKALISTCLAVMMVFSILRLPVCDAGENHPDPRGADIRDKFLAAVNKTRSVKRICGSTPYGPAPPLSWSGKLAMAAHLHSRDMVSNDFFSHTGSDGSIAGQRISRQGYPWRAYGENIAVGVPTVSSVIRGWLESEGHCRNLMDPAFTEVGAGYAVGPFGGDPAARYWTLDLATVTEQTRRR
ncbi:MAG: CAP domain-containing protein [bacterium]